MRGSSQAAVGDGPVVGGRGPGLDAGSGLGRPGDGEGCEDPVHDRRGALAAAVVALVPGVVHVYHFLNGTISVLSAFLGCGIGAILSGLLLVGAGLAYRCPTYPAPARTTLAGGALGTLVAGVLVAQQVVAGGSIMDPAYLVAAAATYGSVGRYATGAYRDHARAQSTQADNFVRLFDTFPHPAVHLVVGADEATVRGGNDAFAETFDAVDAEGRSAAALLAPPDTDAGADPEP